MTHKKNLLALPPPKPQTNPRNQLGNIFLIAAALGFCLINFIPALGLDRILLFSGYSLRRLLSAFFDASLVGALADWFAVTALFRNPLGIPLPHTDVLAKNKDSMAQALPRFLAGFIRPEAIRAELEQIDFSGTLEKTLSTPEIRVQIQEFVRDHLIADPQAIEKANPSELVRLLMELTADTFDAPAACATLITWARKERFDDRLIEGAAGLLMGEMARNHKPLVDYLTPRIKKASGWQGVFIGSGTVDRALKGIHAELVAIKREKDHELRNFLRSALDSWAKLLGSPGEMRDQATALVQDSLRNPLFQERVTAFFGELVQNVSHNLTEPDSQLPLVLGRIEDAIVRRLGEDPVFRSRLNAGMVELLSSLVVKSRLIENAVEYLVIQLKKTDTREFVSRVEGSVWNDLQYIRVNGAVVGGLAGIVLSLLSLIIPY